MKTKCSGCIHVGDVRVCEYCGRYPNHYATIGLPNDHYEPKEDRVKRCAFWRTNHKTGKNGEPKISLNRREQKMIKKRRGWEKEPKEHRDAYYKGKKKVFKPQVMYVVAMLHPSSGRISDLDRVYTNPKKALERRDYIRNEMCNRDRSRYEVYPREVNVPIRTNGEIELPNHLK